MNYSPDRPCITLASATLHRLNLSALWNMLVRLGGLCRPLVLAGVHSMLPGGVKRDPLLQSFNIIKATHEPTGYYSDKINLQALKN